jgi:hypothetical protein
MMINQIQKMIPPQKNKFLSQRIPPEAGEGEEATRKSIRRLWQRRLRNCSLIPKNWIIATGQWKRRKNHLPEEEKAEGIEEIEMTTKGEEEEINKAEEGSLEVEAIDKGKMEEAIKVGAIIEIMKVEGTSIEVEKEDRDTEGEIEMVEIEMAGIEMVDKTTIEEIIMRTESRGAITTEAEEVMVIEVEAEEAISEIITTIEIMTDHKPKSNK